MKKEQKHTEEIIFLAWHIEAFARQKKLPKLDRLFKDIKRKAKPKRKISQDELIKIAKSKGLMIPETNHSLK